ncbi:hypothetical protein KQH90_03160, partial [Anaerosalibacter bizertensis]|uniref:collagen binding domain-containing protein n=1 Tax=Anaerosalibacter bizertensis TaxID=932217 RepID=UPI002469220E
MKFFSNKGKYSMVIMVILALVMQLVIPIHENYALGEEEFEENVERELKVEGESENVEDEVNSEDTPNSKEVLTKYETNKTEIKNLGEEKLKEVNKRSGTEFKFITDVEITDENGNHFEGPIAKDSKIRIQYNYEIENELNVDINQKYTLEIPEEINIIENMKIQLKNGNGDLIATVNIDTNNNATIQFDENVNEQLYDRSGYFWVYSEFDAEKIGNNGETEIVFDLGGGSSQTIVVEFEKEEETANVNLSKSGEYDNDKNEITWNIEIRPETTPNGRSIENVVISDVIQEGQTYVENSAIIDNNADGEFKFEGNKLTYTFNESIKDGEVYNISFKTKPDLSAFDKEGKTIYFKNQAEATFNDNGKSISNEASVKTTVDFISKKDEYKYETKQIDWIVEINKNNLEISNAKIVDTIPKGLELVEGSVKLDGKTVETVEYDYVKGDNETYKLTYEFNEIIREKHTLTYSTKVVDPKAYESNESKTYTNKVKLEGNGVPKGATAERGIGVPTFVIEKWGKGYNTSTQEITWEMRVNYNKIKIENAIVEDIIPEGLEYVEDSFGIYKEGSSETDGSNYGKFEYKDGTIKYAFNGEINDTYILTFKTKVLNNNIWANNASKNFNNTAKLTGDNIPESKSTGNQKVSSQVIKKTGTGYDYLTREASWKIEINQNRMPMNNVVVTDVIGKYEDFVKDSVVITGPSKDNAKINYNEENKTLTIEFPKEIKDIHIIEFKTKIVDESIFYTNEDQNLDNTATINGDEVPKTGVSSTASNKIENTVANKTGNYKSGNNFIDWEVVLNQNQLPISNAILEDTLQEGLELDTSSVKLIKLIVDKDGKYKEGEEVALDASNVKYNPETRKFEFHFTGEITEAHVLKFRTDIADSHKDATFTNTINFKGSSRTTTDTSEEIKVRFQIGGGGAGGSSRGSINVVKVDGEDESIKLEGAVFELLDTFGNVLKTSEPTGENGEALFKGLKFDTTYYIREKVSPDKYALSDEVYEFQLNNEDGKKDIEYKFENKKIRGTIEFSKLGEDKKPLAGAEFTLYSKDNDKLAIATAVSDSKGKVVFENIPYGNYIIKETKAPAGYLLSGTELKASITEDGKTIKANPESISNKKIRGTIEFSKLGEDKKPLAGAEFTLYSKDNDKLAIATAVSDSKGKVVFENIPYGNY